MGVDLDGDRDVDNKWGMIASLLNQYVTADLNDEIAEEIAAGRLLLVGRVYPAEPVEGEPRSLVQLLLAEVHDLGNSTRSVFALSDDGVLAYVPAAPDDDQPPVTVGVGSTT